jgi:hypothetical protein
MVDVLAPDFAVVCGDEDESKCSDGLADVFETSSGAESWRGRS